ncbi:hypothetical protein FUAX_04930 [Fulvitalea axinellae]|uniref:DUF3267 domain-containing protein n=1 Tax=Fulvitalea axinellae TaxID=1182444 RepID=A0AAU9C7J8_9BACT|nr:hypothetical protein FUAX_04930 [Fulvitalea axinellae]
MKDIENFKKEKLTVNLVWANVFGFLILVPISVVYITPYYFLWNDDSGLASKLTGMKAQEVAFGGIYVLVALVLGIIIHELIHGITWARFAKNGFKSIKFGILWKMLTPYCHCMEPLKVKDYIKGAIMPAIVLGFVPAVLAIVTGHLGLLAFGIFFTMAASGDFLIINLIRKENMEDMVQDHPSEVGCYIYRREERSAEVGK